MNINRYDRLGRKGERLYESEHEEFKIVKALVNPHTIPTPLRLYRVYHEYFTLLH